MTNKKGKFAIGLIEDDSGLSLVLQKELTFWGYKVRAFSDGGKALENIPKETFDLILSDVNLPTINGIELVKKLRQSNKKIPIIIMTGYEPGKAEIKSFECRANIFHAKPINYELLRLQIEMLLSNKKKGNLSLKNLEVDPQKFILKKEGQIIKLTRREFDLFHLLSTNPGDIFNRDEIIRTLQMKNYDAEQSSVDTLVSRLRKKVGTYNGENIVETVYGAGYRLNLNYLEE